MKNNDVYIIGEIGQNHNGSVDIAKLIVDLAVRPIHEEVFNLELKPINAIKMTKRDLAEELSKGKMQEVYNNDNSFGRTYGEHRRKLELDDNQHFELYKYSKEKGVDFVETICAIGAMSVLNQFTPDYLKVASRDLTNIPLLSALAETKLPIILSTGMANKNDLNEAMDIITKHHNNITILHCTSEYPTQPGNVNLKAISYLLKKYPDYKIGFSDHTIGISMAIAAVALGARFIEKHITIDRRMKGTDQAGSLGPDGLNRMIRDIRLLEMALGEEDVFIKADVEKNRIKLERSLASNKQLVKGHIIAEEDLHLLSPGDGYKWRDKHLIIGKKVKNDIDSDMIIYEKDLC